MTATAAQISYLNDLLNSRELPAQYAGFPARVRTRIEAGTLDRTVASESIDWLKRQPVKGVAASPRAEFPAGRYALDVDGVVKFYKVDKPTEGRWAGRTFVKVQASDDLYPVRGADADRVLDAIAADPKGASIRYGQSIGECGVCGRTLTNPESIEAGIGPICAGRF